MKKMISACLMVASCLLLIPREIEAQTATWPQFRGTNSSGVANENQEPPVKFGIGELTLWNVPLSKGCSSPCIWDDRIFITGFDEEANLFHMYCINRFNGTVLWKKELQPNEMEKVHRVSYPANATPATDGKRVVFYLGSYGLICYSPEGVKQWELKMPVPTSRHGMGSSPVISGDLVILNCFNNSDDPCLLALNKYNGEKVWKYSWPVEENTWVDSYSTPVIHGDQVIIYRSADVSAYDLHSGKQKWRFQTGMGDAVCTPVIGNGLLFVTVFSTLGNPTVRALFPGFGELASERDRNQDHLIDKEELTGFEFLVYPEKGREVSGVVEAADMFGFCDQNKDSYIDSTEWNGLLEMCEESYLKQGIKALRTDGEGDITFSGFAWGEREHVPHVTSPLFYRDRVYMIKSGGILSCFQADDGALLYSDRIDAAGAYFASPIAANGKIYFTSRNGVITVVEEGENLKILARNDLDEIISATPALVDNKIYMRTDNNLYAFGTH